MAFHFSLRALLRLRESVEKAELLRLQTIAAQAVQMRIQIESLDGEILARRQELLDQAASGISGAELHLAALSEAVRQQRRTAMLTKLREIEQARKKQQLRYTHARQQREILSNLRERQLSVYLREQARREQQQVDELFLIRRAHRARQ
jgi:flagellar export protein FliJ